MTFSISSPLSVCVCVHKCAHLCVCVSVCVCVTVVTDTHHGILYGQKNKRWVIIKVWAITSCVTIDLVNVIIMLHSVAYSQIGWWLWVITYCGHQVPGQPCQCSLLIVLWDSTLCHVGASTVEQSHIGCSSIMSMGSHNGTCTSMHQRKSYILASNNHILTHILSLSLKHMHTQ